MALSEPAAAAFVQRFPPPAEADRQAHGELTHLTKTKMKTAGGGAPIGGFITYMHADATRTGSVATFDDVRRWADETSYTWLAWTLTALGAGLTIGRGIVARRGPPTSTSSNGSRLEVPKPATRGRQMPAYETRSVAFVDILGFADLVQRSGRDQGFFGTLNDALRVVELHGRAWAAQHASAGAGEKPEDTDFRSQVFSDSIIFSSRGQMAAPLFISVSQLSMALLRLGVLIRGGIAEGLLYHDDRVVFGPALVEAYRLESKAATYPRVIVSKEVLVTCRQNEVKFYADGVAQEPHNASEFLRRDADRLFHVDYLSTALISPGAIIGADAADFRRRAQAAGALALSKLADPSLSMDVKAKWGWFVDYFNDVARVRTSQLPDQRLDPLATDDDHIEPVTTWDRLRTAFYRKRGEG